MGLIPILVKKSINRGINRFTTYTAEQIIERIKDYQYISFDVFETLIRRRLEYPQDLFEIVALEYNKKNEGGIDSKQFKNDRINAANKARENALDLGKDEITLDEIYVCLEEKYAMNQTIKEEEVQQEKKICYADPILKQVFDWCINNNKQVVLASDMYLGKEIIENILNICGYKDYKQLYLSSDLLIKKRDGKLFRFIIDDLSINPREIVHIGDNLMSDYVQAQKNGIKSILIARIPCRARFVRSGVSKKQDVCVKKLEAIMNGYISQQWDSYFQYGFEVIGPLLFGFAKWIHEVAKQNDIGKMLFLARDGKLLQKAYIQLFADETLKNDYLYVSRKSMTYGLIWKRPGLTEMLENGSRGKWNCEMLCNRLGIELTIGQSKWAEVGLKEKQLMSTEELLRDKRVHMFYSFFKEEIIMESKKQYQLIVDYLSDTISERVGIVDIGWAGTIQKCIDEYIKDAGIDASTWGLYLSVNEKFHDDIVASMFIDRRENMSLYTGAFIEFPFTSSEGTTIGYYEDELGNIQPTMKNNEYDGRIEANIVESIQAGAMEFVEFFSPLRDYFDMDSCLAYHNLRYMAKKPRFKDVELFGDFLFYNDKFIKLAAPRSLLFYIRHPKRFKMDLSSAGWKYGFFKRLFRVPFPYDELISDIRVRK